MLVTRNICISTLLCWHWVIIYEHKEKKKHFLVKNKIVKMMWRVLEMVRREGSRGENNNICIYR